MHHKCSEIPRSNERNNGDSDFILLAKINDGYQVLWKTKTYASFQFQKKKYMRLVIQISAACDKTWWHKRNKGE